MCGALYEVPRGGRSTPRPPAHVLLRRAAAHGRARCAKQQRRLNADAAGAPRAPSAPVRAGADGAQERADATQGSKRARAHSRPGRQPPRAPARPAGGRRFGRRVRSRHAGASAAERQRAPIAAHGRRCHRVRCGGGRVAHAMRQRHVASALAMCGERAVRSGGGYKPASADVAQQRHRKRATDGRSAATTPATQGHVNRHAAHTNTH